MSPHDTYYRRKAAGLCVVCEAPAEPGRTRCRPCLDAIAEKLREQRRHRREQGLCTRCGEPVPLEIRMTGDGPTHRRFCDRCRRWMQGEHRKYRAPRKG